MLNDLTTRLKRDKSLPLLPAKQLRKMGLLYSSYRLVISIFLFLSSYASIFESDSLTASLPSFLQQTTLLFYCLFSLLLLALFYFIPRQPVRQIGIGLMFDIIVISLLLYTSGTPDIQMAMLYLVVVSASFLLLPPYQALIITLSAIIFIVYQQFFYAVNNHLGLAELGDALLLSLSFIGVGYLSWYVSQRLANIEQFAKEQADELFKLNTINEQVVSSITHGVMVLNQDLKLQLTNQASLNLLDLELPQNLISNLNNDKFAALIYMQKLNIQHPSLAEWLLHAPRKTQATFNYELKKNDLLVGRLRINTTPLEGKSLLVLIEDIQREQVNAQQLKLASLGQLTASIAHEIRNPLAAISQASQLLIEDAEFNALEEAQGEEPPESNIELYEMIFNQTKRVNRIIEDVLKLSKQTKPNSTTFHVMEWMDQFVSEQYTPSDVVITKFCEYEISFDTRQLEQILINLVNNGLRYARKTHPDAKVEIEIECTDTDIIIDVLDTGVGVSSKDQINLFNPFFTTHVEGTGLGLYLSQSFAQANNAKLMYVPEHQKTCFRLVIPKVIDTVAE